MIEEMVSVLCLILQNTIETIRFIFFHIMPGEIIPLSMKESPLRKGFKAQVNAILKRHKSRQNK